MTGDIADVVLELDSQVCGRRRLDPARDRAVPHERMALDLHTVAQRVSHDRIAGREIVEAGAPADDVHLHLVLGRLGS